MRILPYLLLFFMTGIVFVRWGGMKRQDKQNDQSHDEEDNNDQR